MDATQRLAEFAFTLKPEQLPASTLQEAARMALDTVSSALPAWQAPGVLELRELMADWTRGDACVWVGGERLAPDAATLVNSAMAHALEYDDLHCDLPIHSGVVVVPAALAVAETRPGLSGAEIAAAIVVGTEILCRLARATLSYRGTAGFRGWNPTSVVAGFATAAVAGRLLGLDADGIARAMGISYVQAGGNQQCIADGGLTKRMQPGIVAAAGVRAAWLARAGVTGAIDAIEGKNGFFALYEQGAYDAEALTGGLGETYEIDRVDYKRYPVCGMAQPAVDALREILADNGLSGADVETVDVAGSKFVVDMVGRPYRPGSSPDVDAQFSLPYGLASVLQTGNLTLADLRPENTLDDSRRALADRIAVRLDDDLKGKWEARVEVTLPDGRLLTRTRAKTAGQTDRPVTTEELVAKFRDAAAAAGGWLGSADAERLCSLLLDLPGLPDARAIFDLLAGGTSRQTLR